MNKIFFKLFKRSDRFFSRTLFLAAGLASLLLAASVMAGQVSENQVSGEAQVVPTVKNEELKKAENLDVASVLASIRRQYLQEMAFSGRFTQKTTYSDSHETTLSMGLIWIQGPDKMRWEYQLPEKQLLVSDGQTLWYYTPDLNQVMTGSVKDIKEARIIINLLSELQLQAEKFKLAVTKVDDRIVVELAPLANDPAPPFQKLEMIFSAASYMLAETRMVDLFANEIVITYKWQSGPDKALPRSFFTFIPPAGCDMMPLGQ
ncbi:MAG: outer membrane lipoprotein carrier protein LolA [Deltaproteobacteria bacterium]|nr:outer membrane lipoprotein carrier protein LolA [Deltaproteobacteria bacterium]